MTTNSLVQLAVRPVYVQDVFKEILTRSQGKLVLNVGAAGGIHGYLPHKREEWLHHKIRMVASNVVGIDIDVDGVAYAQEHGEEIRLENCEELEAEEIYDLVVLSDVIEHLDSPLKGVCSLMKQLKKGGSLILTTPNPSSFGIIGRTILGLQINVYWDHVSCFSPEHIQAICDRKGYSLELVGFFDHIDRRTLSNSIKSLIGRQVSRINPRMASAYMAVIRHKC